MKRFLALLLLLAPAGFLFGQSRTMTSKDSAGCAAASCAATGSPRYCVQTTTLYICDPSTHLYVAVASGGGGGTPGGSNTQIQFNSGGVFAGNSGLTFNSGTGVLTTGGGVTVGGNSTINGTLTGLTGLTVASGTVTLPAGQIDASEAAASFVQDNEASTFSLAQTFNGGIKTNAITNSTIDTPVTHTWNSTTLPGLSTLAASLPVLAQAQIDYTIANATTNPGFVSEAIPGTCTGTVNLYALWTGPGGTTAVGTALQHTMVTNNRKINLSTPSSPPAGATKWNVAWESTGALGTFWNCAASPATIGVNIACACATNLGTPGVSNTTGLVNVARLKDGQIDFATYNGTLIQQARTALGFGTDNQLTLSLAGGSFYPILTSNTGLNSGPQVVTACPSGCQYADLTAACTAKAASSTQSSPIFFVLGPGTYTTTQTCNLAYGGIIGWGRGVTRIIPSVQSGNAMLLDGSHDIIVSGLTASDSTAIKWQGSPTGTNYISDVVMDASGGTAIGDCIGSSTWANGSVLHMRHNTCIMGPIQGSDGITVQSNAGGLTLYLRDNVVTGTGAITGSADGAAFFLTQGDTLYARDNDITMTRSGTTGGGAIGYYFGGPSGGASGQAIHISGGNILLHSTTTNGNSGYAIGINFLSATPNATQLDIHDLSVDVTVDDASTGRAQGMIMSDPDVPVTLYGSHFSATGGTTTYGIDGAGAGKIAIGADTDFGSAHLSSLAILKGEYTGTALAAAPAKCNVGDMYRDISPTLCLCTSANSWTCGLSPGAGVGWSALTTGTNSSAHMTVGTGAILDVSGSGSVLATDVNCSACISASELGSGFLDAVGDISNSLGTDGQILKKVSGAWALAADATGGSPSFDQITSNTNTTAAMVVGTGASLTTSGSGSIIATTGDSATAFFPSGTLEDARLSANVPLLNIANLFASSGTQQFQDPVSILPDATNGVTVNSSGLLAKSGTGSVQADDVNCSGCVDLSSEVTGALPATSISGTITDAQVSDTLTCSAVTQGAAPSLTTAGQVGVDTTADQWLWYSGAGVQVESATKEVCAVVPNLSVNDDNFEFWTPPYPVHATSAGCYCRGTCAAALPTFQFTNRAGTAMTGSPTCATGTTATTFTALSGSTALVAGDGLRFNVTNSPLGSEGLDTYTICVKYTIDRQ